LKKKNQKPKKKKENPAHNQIDCAIKIQRQSVELKLVGNVMLAIFHCRLKRVHQLQKSCTIQQLVKQNKNRCAAMHFIS
jgi:hypothetical protein